MATEGQIETQSLVAAADYRAAAFVGKIVKIDTAAADQAIVVAVLGARGDAVLMNNPNIGQPCEVVTDGFAKAQCGAAIASAGLELTPDATGRLITAVSTNTVFALSRNATAAAGEWVGLKILGPYVKP
jgi:hypothetical protein